MKIVYIIIIGLILVIAGFFVFHRTTNYTAPTTGTNIVVFGDSLAYSQGSTPGHDLATLLSQQLGLPAINSGVSGDTAVQSVKRVDTDVMAHNPKVVVILLGGNDFFQRIPPEQTMIAMRTIVEKILYKGAGVVLVNENKSFATAAMFKSLAKDKNIPYIENIMNGILGDPKLMSDTIHPNDAGYEVMANKISPILKSYLGVK